MDVRSLEWRFGPAPTFFTDRAMDTFYQLIGKDSDEIVWWQMVCRGTLIFLYTMVLIRFGGRRIFGKLSSFDIVVGIMLGSIMSRAITGNARFFPTLVTGTAIVALHWLLAELARRSRTLGWLIKGRPVQIIADGQLRHDQLRRTTLTEADVLEAVRSNAGLDSVAGIKAAYLERSGDVSVVR